MFNHLFVALLVPFFLSKVALGKYEPLQIPLASEPADLNTQFDNHHHEPGLPRLSLWMKAYTHLDDQGLIWTSILSALSSFLCMTSPGG